MSTSSDDPLVIVNGVFRPWSKLSRSEQQRHQTRQIQIGLNEKVDWFNNKGLVLREATQKAREAGASSVATSNATGVDTLIEQEMTEITRGTVLTREKQDRWIGDKDLSKIKPPISDRRYAHLQKTKDDP